MALEGQVMGHRLTSYSLSGSPSLSASAYLSAQLFPGEFASAVKVFLEPLSFAKKHIFVWTLEALYK